MLLIYKKFEYVLIYQFILQKWEFLVANMSWRQTFNFQIVFGYLKQVLVFLCYDGDFSLLFILKLFFDLSLAGKKKKATSA